MKSKAWQVLEDMRAQRERLLSLVFWALVVYRFGHVRDMIRSR